MAHPLVELKRAFGWGRADEEALRARAPLSAPELERISHAYCRRLPIDGALHQGVTSWIGTLFTGPWDDSYFDTRVAAGRSYARLAITAHDLVGAAHTLRAELGAAGKIVDLDLAILMHAYDGERARNEQLAGSIGHELRNPLGVIESSLHVLRGRTTDERISKHVERIGEQVVIANRIISDLLDLVRDRPLVRERVGLAALIGEVIAAVQPNGARIVAEGFTGLPDLAANASMLRQVFMNLVENAVHAAGASGEVRVLGSAGPDGHTIAVEDSGPGVTDVVHLFEPLHTTKPGGTGLGLALAKRIVERHGGTITYEQANGARFVVRLPSKDADV